MSIALDYRVNQAGGSSSLNQLKDDEPSPAGGGSASANAPGMNPDGTPRTGRACLACRKLKVSRTLSLGAAPLPSRMQLTPTTSDAV